MASDYNHCFEAARVSKLNTETELCPIQQPQNVFAQTRLDTLPVHNFCAWCLQSDVNGGVGARTDADPRRMSRWELCKWHGRTLHGHGVVSTTST